METVLGARPDTNEGDLLEVLSLLVHDYEQKKHKIEALSPIDALKYEMEEQGLTQSGLAKRLGIVRAVYPKS
ncbi:MAG: hypothetical protein ABIX01_00135 [Chitinophagaceae bacterium]